MSSGNALDRLREAVEARDPGAVLAVLAKDGQAPYGNALAEWLATEAPEAAEAVGRDTARLRRLARVIVDRVDPEAPEERRVDIAAQARFGPVTELQLRTPDASPALSAWLPYRIAAAPTVESFRAGLADTFGDGIDPEARERYAARGAEVFGSIRPGAAWLEMAHGWAALAKVFLAAREHDDSLRLPGRHLVEAWQKRPPTVRANTRPDPTLPVVWSEAPERTAGRFAFGGILDVGTGPPDGQLPLFAEATGPRVALLDIADMRGGPIMARGRGAPLDLRLLIGGCIMEPQSVRARRVRLAVTVRELRSFLFPNGWQRGRDWPRVQQALARAHTYQIPGVFEWEGRKVHGWIPFALRGGAGDGAELDDIVLIDVELPPGSASGPIIDRQELARLGVASAPRFRAYIAAHSVAWLPGRTRVPYPGGGKPRLWTRDPDKYPVLTAEDRDRLAYGEGSTAIGAQSRADKDAHWTDLPGVAIVTRSATAPDGRHGWRIVPKMAAEAIQTNGTK